MTYRRDPVDYDWDDLTHEWVERGAPLQVFVTFDPCYRHGDLYEWGVAGDDKVWGDYLDPAVVDPTTWDTDDTDGHRHVWVRPCSYAASRNAAGIMAVPR